MRCAVKPTVNPDTDVCTTYLYSEPNAKFLTTDDTNFPVGIIRVGSSLMGESKLNDNTGIRTLYDSGASKSMIQKRLCQSHPLLQSAPRYKIAKRKIVVANDAIITVTEAIKLVVKMDGHVFEMIAYIAEFCKEFDFVFGLKSGVEIEASFHLAASEITFVSRSIALRATKQLNIPPGRTGSLTAVMTKVPANFTHAANACIKVDPMRKDGVMQTVKAEIIHGHLKIMIRNNSTQTLRLHSNHLIGYVDMRSVGYWHMTRTYMSRVLQPYFHTANSPTDPPSNREEKSEDKYQERY